MYVVVSNVTFGFGTQTSCRILEIITLFPVYSFSCKSLSLNETGVLFSSTGRVKLILGVSKKKKKRECTMQLYQPCAQCLKWHLRN